MELTKILSAYGFKETYSKNIKKAFLAYRKSTTYNVNEAYKKPSQLKIDAFKMGVVMIQNIVKATSGEQLDWVKVIYKNSSCFTMGVPIICNGVRYFLYITPTKRWYINLDKEI